ncbi:Uncharacterized protein PBTT_09746 [Plasmodiophora brassicae]
MPDTISNCVLNGTVDRDGLFTGTIVNVHVDGTFAGQISNGGNDTYFTDPCPPGPARETITMQINNGVLKGTFYSGSIANALILNGKILHGRLTGCTFAGKLTNGGNTIGITQRGTFNGAVNENFIGKLQAATIRPLIKDNDKHAIEARILSYLSKDPE